MRSAQSDRALRRALAIPWVVSAGLRGDSSGGLAYRDAVPRELVVRDVVPEHEQPEQQVRPAFGVEARRCYERHREASTRAQMAGDVMTVGEIRDHVGDRGG